MLTTKISDKCKPVLLGCLLISPFSFSLSDSYATVMSSNVDCSGELCRQAVTRVPLKVLPRPRSSIYVEQSIDSKKVIPVVPALSPLFVFARVGVDEDDSDGSEGWYRVGATETLNQGWMRAADVIEWHNTLILSYTPPGIDDEKRNPVLGFRTFDDLTALVTADEREGLATSLIDGVISTPPGEAVSEDIKTAGVVSAEPEGVYKDIKDNFYMWPILSWAAPDDPDSDERYLEFLQLVPECRADHVVADGSEADDVVLAGSGGDDFDNRTVDALNVVFVVDTTGSMKPYIEAVKEGIHATAKSVAAKIDNIKFGFVGYQDDFDELAYISKDFFSEGLGSAEDFESIIDEQVRAETWGRHLVPERLYEGFDTGVNASWEDNAVKFMIVVTDAPAIPSSDGEQGSVDETYVNLIGSDREAFDKLAAVSVADAERNGKVARDSNINLFALHIKPGRHRDMDSLAESQLAALVQNENTDSGYISIDGSSGRTDEFGAAIKTIANTMIGALGVDSVDEVIAETGSDEDISDVAAEVVKSALMDFLGDVEVNECDYRGWTTDRDLADSAVKALDVNTLLVRDQLDTLYTALVDVRDSVVQGDMTGEGFIDTLASIGGSMLIDPEMLEKARSGTLASSGILPRWLETLPYKSAIASLTGDDINEMTSAERTQLEINVSAKIDYYKSIIENNELWFALSERDEDNQLKKVTPLPIDELP